jgi:hypothetical protein
MNASAATNRTPRREAPMLAAGFEHHRSDALRDRETGWVLHIGALRTSSFCCAGCLDRFSADPSAFVTAATSA